jgi:transcriptional regulator with XRE-family HTH domain
MALAARIYYLMLQAGISQTILSEQTKIERTTLTRILNGTTEKPKLETLINLAKYFKVDISELLNDRDNFEPILSIQIVMRELMRINGIPNSFALAKLTHLPRSTISEILKGRTLHPKIKTLQVLSDFFEVTIPQLCGYEPISGLQEFNPQTSNNNYSVPLLEIDSIINWINSPKRSPFVNYINVSGENITNLAYAIKIKDNKYFPDVMIDNVLIVDGNIQPKSGDLVICTLNNRAVSILEQISINDDLIKYREAGTKTIIEVPLTDVNFMGVVIQRIIKRI